MRSNSRCPLVLWSFGWACTAGGGTDMTVASEGGTIGGSTGVTSSPSSTGVASADDEAGEVSDSATGGGPAGPCLPVEVELAFGEDVPAVFDASQGSYACLSLFDEVVRLKLAFAPIEHSYLLLEVRDGARTYDLATDPGPPGTGQAGLIELRHRRCIPPGARSPAIHVSPRFARPRKAEYHGRVSRREALKIRRSELGCQRRPRGT